MKVDIYFDGSCGNIKNASAPMGVGIAVFISGQYDEELSKAIGIATWETKDRGTNNIAEYIGCVEAMKLAGDIKRTMFKADCTVYSDSQFVVNTFNGISKLKEEHYKKYKEQAHNNRQPYGSIKLEWIPREQNQKADELSKLGRQLAISKSINYGKEENKNRGR
jgi:ribonuclease HI